MLPSSIIQIGAYNYYENFNSHNALYDRNAYSLGEDMEYAAITLRQTLNKYGADLNTLDIHPISEYKKIIFWDLPEKGTISLEELHRSGKELYLVLCESEIIKKGFWDKRKHSLFKKIFTWNDQLVDGHRYIKYWLPNKIPTPFIAPASVKEKLCILIASNKSNSDKRELYRARIKAIDWFENNHPDDFDLYGYGWEKGAVKNRFLFKTIRHFNSYKGTISHKIETLSKYKFSICYENARDISGYITEKIIDCFLAGTVPIYLGADNICDYVPESTFIDQRKFNNFDDLYAYIINILDQEYEQIQESIKRFLNSQGGRFFSAEHFAEIIANHII